MKAGACGFLEKPVGREALLGAVGRVLAAGEVEVCRVREREQLARRHDRLSKRGKQVMDHLVRGLSSRQVGELLHISEKTVKAHRARVRAKMEMDSRPELVLAARALGRI